MRLEELFAAEGLNFEPPPPKEVDGNLLVNSALFLFGFIPEPDDPRWIVINSYASAKQSTKFRPVTFESALSGVYLSQALSYRNGYGKWSSAQNIRQLCRAIVSMDSHGQLRDVFTSMSPESFPDLMKLELARTNRILKGSDQHGITGCPEAAYQLRMFDGRKYLGRVGFNVHKEGGLFVVSLTNIQGVPGAREKYEEIADKIGKHPHNYLVDFVRSMASIHTSSAVIRGLKNPAKEEARPFYNKVFKTEGIERMSFERRAIALG
jgi:hypothetical protein